jgi:hypothetical protein
MKKSILKSFLIMGIAIVTLSACTALNHSMGEPNVRVNLNKADFTLSEQMSGEASSTKILGIDFARLFTKNTGHIEGGAPASLISLANLPVIGTVLTDKTANYALYELMTKAGGYDVIFYPQYETKVVRPIGIGFIYKVTTVKVTARLGKLNK